MSKESEWNKLDLIEQLRQVRDSWMDPTTKVGGRKPLTKAAANEIERLRAEVERLRAEIERLTGDDR